MSTITLTIKITSLYVAYAPEFDVSAYGGCQDEALNNLTDEIRQQHHHNLSCAVRYSAPAFAFQQFRTSDLWGHQCAARNEHAHNFVQSSILCDLARGDQAAVKRAGYDCSGLHHAGCPGAFWIGRLGSAPRNLANIDQSR